ncbi:hypothetical protein CN324_29220 [Bacillus anthracis]|nr:hypothetical protein DT250_13605 [Bacillus sp. AR2-1]PED52085.1 hypothetical protein CON50_28480 [Bacillus anthracis]PEL85462.1 hypothetical protein CN626_27640 [Bacillus wiedmannii]PHA12816.1 hypothetical protein COE65_08290 [Bacillus sp. AFS051223]PEF63539.1 hypothetical protein CON33_25270 [Bacillus anthracis]
MRHDVGIMREKRPKNKIYIRPRLRIHGSTDILEYLKYTVASETLYSFDLGFHDAEEFEETHQRE